MSEKIASINSVVNSFIWGVPAMICIIGVGILLTVRTRCIQVRKFGVAMKNTIGKIFDKTQARDGSMSPFQAVCTALAGTVGTGNIAGVAGAIALGGPGAIFWMWCSAFLGMCTKFSEVTLAIHFREKNKNGEYVSVPVTSCKEAIPAVFSFKASTLSFSLLSNRIVFAPAFDKSPAAPIPLFPVPITSTVLFCKSMFLTPFLYS